MHVGRDFVEDVKETIEEDKIRYRLYARDQRLIPETSLIRSVLIVHVPRSKITARSLQRDNINRRIQFAHLVHYSRMRRDQENRAREITRDSQLFSQIILDLN